MMGFGRAAPTALAFATRDVVDSSLVLWPRAAEPPENRGGGAGRSRKERLMARLFKKSITRYLDADGRRVPKATPGARKVT